MEHDVGADKVAKGPLLRDLELLAGRSELGAQRGCERTGISKTGRERKRRKARGISQRRTVVPMHEMKAERKELKGKLPTKQAYPKRMAAVLSAKTMKASMTRSFAGFSLYDLRKDETIEPRDVIARDTGGDAWAMRPMR